MEHGECDLDHLLRLTTGVTKLEGTLHVEPLESVKGISVEAFQAFLSGCEVRSCAIDPDEIAALCAQVIEAPLQPHERIVAQGKQAINGNSVTYAITPSIVDQIEAIKRRKETIQEQSIAQNSLPDQESMDEDEAVNYYDQMAFVIVQRGDQIAIKTERSDGIDGCDIFGKVIPAHEGKSNEGVLDSSILVSSDGTCTAAIAGVLSADPESISVSNELVIKDDVDFQTGRIIFPGSVVIGGSVRDRFSVKADGEITVRGMVEVADLESAQSIILDRGMAGKETGTIKAGLNLQAGYLEGVNAEIGGNVSIRGEITNSNLSIRGQLHAEYAALRGGTLQVSNGGKIGSIGSVQGVETELLVGSLPVVERDIRAIDGFMVQLETQIQSQTSTMEVFSASIAKPTPSQIEEQMGMQFEIDEMSTRQKQLSAAKAQLVELLNANTRVRIQVQKGIHAKVNIFLPGYRAEFPTDLMGESVIQLGPTGHPSISYRGKTVNLSEHARVISDDRILRVLENHGSLNEAA